jgi:hypothetical protein
LFSWFRLSIAPVNITKCVFTVNTPYYSVSDKPFAFFSFLSDKSGKNLNISSIMGHPGQKPVHFDGQGDKGENSEKCDTKSLPLPNKE